jgi:hypothetical protein
VELILKQIDKDVRTRQVTNKRRVTLTPKDAVKPFLNPKRKFDSKNLGLEVK